MNDERTFIALIVADATVVSALGSDGNSQVKLYASNTVPQGLEMPYATYFDVTGVPTNKLKSTPDSDRLIIQIDVFSRSKAQARAIGTAIRNIAQQHGRLLGFRDLYDADLMAHQHEMDFSYFGT